MFFARLYVWFLSLSSCVCGFVVRVCVLCTCVVFGVMFGCGVVILFVFELCVCFRYCCIVLCCCCSCFVLFVLFPFVRDWLVLGLFLLCVLLLRLHFLLLYYNIIARCAYVLLFLCV